ncbi:MAG: ATP-dependent helicase C-terminal domain-containing protein [Treponema sp.]|uniref:ATP-dependent RNA helicase n=1 Tax=Treponema sp. TaxID=166 RepID=UPI002A91B0C2|nr:ATP-dependent helicase C-terminal domain-containing protein [Treponema sp.]MDY6397384.1 ATP-dependent helicase C-terminal domain-containing protein [Treponema sp.]
MPDFPRAYEKLSSLPISPFLPEICSALKSSKSRFLVLTAETAAGKSTAVPIALLEHFEGKILMLEPRRLAASAIADRLSDLLGEESGGTVGYRLHLDSKVSERTRLEVITEAILTRRLQADPLLEDVNVIVLDEFHERSIHSDLALAFLKETMQLRDDLFVIVMSATINYRSIADYLGSKEKPAPVMQIPGRQFPVEIEYKPNMSVADAILEELKTNDSCETDFKNKTSLAGVLGSGENDTKFRSDTILCFLPGIYEIRKTKVELEEKLTSDSSIEILILHSSVPLGEQRKIFRPCSVDSPRRVILSSAIAETSLTVPGVTIVVDSGLCRVNKMNVALGMEHLVTENESLFSAEQRVGRAGRVAAGRCVRLWGEHDVRLEQNQPEILRADLTGLVLECAEWGAGEIEKLDWLTRPNESAWNAAKFLLENLDCLEIHEDSDGRKSIRITEKGKAVLKLGLHPRLACVALAGGAESVLPFSEYAEASPERQKIFLNDLKRRLKGLNDSQECAEKTGKSPVLSGFPDRIARISPETQANADRAEYQFPSGRKALLSRELLSQAWISSFPTWLVAPEVDAGERTGKIYSFEPLSENQAEEFLKNHAKSEIRTEFVGLTNGSDFKNLSVQKKEIMAYGAIILKEKKLPIESEDFALALCDLVSKKGLESLPLDSKISDFLLRTEFYIKNQPENERSELVSESELQKKFNSLAKNAKEWLQPFVRSQKINAQDIYDALYWYLDGSEIDSKVPLQISLANGRKRKIKYEKKADGDIQPSLEIIIQQIFGCFETPKILGKPVLLKLLSPANRPLQITEDLEHFWTGAWPEICKEMKGRYPKHNWDYRICEE